jgi:hypothetical protein
LVGIRNWSLTARFEEAFRHFSVARYCKRRRTAGLRAGHSGSISPGRSHDAQSFARRRKGRRVAGGAADTIPARGKLEDCKLLSIALPPSILLRADKVIE